MGALQTIFIVLAIIALLIFILPYILFYISGVQAAQSSSSFSPPTASCNMNFTTQQNNAIINCTGVDKSGHTTGWIITITKTWSGTTCPPPECTNTTTYNVNTSKLTFNTTISNLGQYLNGAPSIMIRISAQTNSGTLSAGGNDASYYNGKWFVS